MYFWASKSEKPKLLPDMNTLLKCILLFVCKSGHMTLSSFHEPKHQKTQQIIN